MPDSPIASSANERRARFRLIGLFGGYKVSQAIYCAVALGLPDILERGPQRAEALARACGCDPSGAEQLLRALRSVGIVSESDGSYAPTPLSRWLCKGVSGSLAATVLFQGNEMYRAFGHLLATLKTGVPGWQAEFGGTLWEYLAQRPDRSALFDQSMSDGHDDDIEPIVAAANSGDALHVVDVGGGNGRLLQRLLRLQPTWTGTLFDRPDVVLRAGEDPAMHSLGERCRLVGGDFFREVPPGADLYLLRHVLHDWNDEQCREILVCCRRAMGPAAKLLVMEALLGTDAASGMAEWSNLSMLLIGGVERPLPRYEALLSTTGFSLLTSRAAGPGLFAIEAHPDETARAGR